MNHPRRKLLRMTAGFLALLGIIGSVPAIWAPVRGVVRAEGEPEPVRSESNRQESENAEASVVEMFYSRCRTTHRQPLFYSHLPACILPGMVVSSRHFQPPQVILCEHCLRNGLGAPLLL